MRRGWIRFHPSWTHLSRTSRFRSYAHKSGALVIGHLHGGWLACCDGCYYGPYRSRWTAMAATESLVREAP